MDCMKKKEKDITLNKIKKKEKNYLQKRRLIIQ